MKEYIKPSYFEEQRIVKFISFQRDKGEAFGSRFVDKFGMTNVFTFEEAGERKSIESSSYPFFADYRSFARRIKEGDTIIVKSVVLSNPDDLNRSYRRWIFQPHFVVKNETNEDNASGN